MTAKLNITIQQGSTFILEFEYQFNGSGINLSDATPQMHIRRIASSEKLLLDATPYISIVNAAEGGIRIEIPAAITEQLKFKKAVYDLELHYLDGFVERLVEGNVVLSLEVTR